MLPPRPLRALSQTQVPRGTCVISQSAVPGLKELCPPAGLPGAGRLPSLPRHTPSWHRTPAQQHGGQKRAGLTPQLSRVLGKRTSERSAADPRSTRVPGEPGGAASTGRFVKPWG